MRVANDAPVAADVLVGDVGATYVTLVLYFDELGVYDGAEDLEDVADDLVGGDGLDQSNHVVGLEITYLFLNLSDNLEVVDREL